MYVLRLVLGIHVCVRECVDVCVCVELCRDTMMDSPASNQDHLHVAWRRPLCRFFVGRTVRSGESSSLACGEENRAIE